MDKLTPEQRKRNMQANKARDTSIERILGRLLWSHGLRYRKNAWDLPGKPDFVFRKKRIAVFCDGEFWHGRNWDQRKNDHKSNRDFWIAKIERNMARDREVTAKLEETGWIVLRFWESDIKKRPEWCAEQIMQYHDAKKEQNMQHTVRRDGSRADALFAE